MGVYIFLILTDIFIWWNLIIDLKHRSRAACAIVITVKSAMTLLLFATIVSLITFRGDFDTPSNISNLMLFGAVAALIVSIGAWYILVSIVIRLFNRVLHRRLSGVVWTNIIISGLIVLLLCDSYFRQRYDIHIVRQEIEIRDLDKRLEGLKIVLISDLHLASFERHYDKLGEMTGIINSLDPDILVNAGDFISYGWREFGECDTILRKAHARYGAFAIAGNHDDGTYLPEYNTEYGKETDSIIDLKTASSGYILLRDTTRFIRYNNATIRIAGITTHGHHLSMRYGNIRRLAVPCDTVDFTLLLAHDPAAWNQALELPGTPQLTLSGHTHGMQVGLPIGGRYISPSSLIHEYWKGLYVKNDCNLFVSSGMGYMGMALRIFMPPEIVLLTLTSK